MTAIVITSHLFERWISASDAARFHTENLHEIRTKKKKTTTVLLRLKVSEQKEAPEGSQRPRMN